MRDLASGSVQVLAFRTLEDSMRGNTQTSALSPDGKSIAYGWYSPITQRSELRVGSLKGSDSGMALSILSSPNLQYVDVEAWTPDGKEVLAMLVRVKDTSGIAAVLAYDARSCDKGDRDVHVMAVDGTRDNVVVLHKGEDVVMGWAKEPGRLLVGSERGGTPPSGPSHHC